MLKQEPVGVESVDALVEQAVGGSPEAFGRLYDLYVDRVYRHLYYRVGNANDAEDLTAEVFLNAWRAIGRYRQQGVPFAAWLFRIARNLAIDHYRSAQRVAELDEAVIDEGREADPEKVMELSLDRQQVRRAIFRLSEEQQQVLILRFVDGLSHADVAAVLGKSEVAVRVMQYRALAALRRALRERG